MDYSFIIKQNLFELYWTFAEETGLNKTMNPVYSWINASSVPWPRFIFDIDPEINDKQLALLDEETGSGKAPKFAIDLRNDRIEQKLSGINFKKVMAWPGMLLPLEKSIKEQQPGLEIKTVTSWDELQLWFQIVSENLFKNQAFESPNLQKLLNLRSVEFLLGFTAGKAVSTLMSFSNQQVAGLYHISTLEKYRGNGFGKQITQNAIKRAAARGSHFAILQANPESHGLYESIGFKDCCIFDIFWKLPKT